MIAVRAIANHLASVPGRKSVIWFAGMFPGAAAALAYSGITPILFGGSHGSDSSQCPQARHPAASTLEPVRTRLARK